MCVYSAFALEVDDAGGRKCEVYTYTRTYTCARGVGLCIGQTLVSGWETVVSKGTRGVGLCIGQTLVSGWETVVSKGA